MSASDSERDPTFRTQADSIHMLAQFGTVHGNVTVQPGATPAAPPQILNAYLRDSLAWARKQIRDLRPVPLSAQDSPSEVNDISISYKGLSPIRPVGQIKEDTPTKPRIFTTFADALREYDDRVLLLGSPGAGKSTTLLTVFRDALEQRIADPNLPLPVIVDIARWNPASPIIGWIEQTLTERYKGLTLRGQSALYLLDGLDELGGPAPEANVDSETSDDPRASFLRELEKQLPHEKVVVSSRVIDYHQLAEKASLLGAVELLPLTEREIEAFLREQGQTALWETIRNDLDILALVQTPLLLAVLSEAAGKTGTISLDRSEISEEGLFRLYVARRFQHEEEKQRREGQVVALPFTRAATEARLGKLAAYLWRGGLYAVSTVERKEIVRELGGESEAFVDFAIRMHLLREKTPGSVQFMHARFRDYFAVPQLIRQLDDEDVRKQWAAARALGLIGDPRAVDGLSNLGNDGNPELMLAAIQALGKIRHPAAVRALIQALDSPSMDFAADALRSSRDPEVVLQLMELMTNDFPNVYDRVQVTQILGEICDPSAVPALIQALDHEDETVRYWAVYALEPFDDPQIVPQLIQAMDDIEVDVRLAAINVLASFDGPTIVPPLIQALMDDDEEVAALASEVLQSINITNLANAIALDLIDIVSLHDLPVETRLAIVINMEDIDPAKKTSVLVEMLHDEDEGVRFDAVCALPSTAIDGLLFALEDNDAQVQEVATDALRAIDDPHLVSRLIAILTAEEIDLNARLAAVQLLGEREDPAALEALIRALRDIDANVRIGAMNALREISDPVVITALIQALDDSDEHVRLEAASILAASNDPQVVPALIHLLENVCTTVYGHRLAAELLGELEDPAAVPALIGRLSAADEYMAQALADALWSIAGSEVLTGLISLLTGGPVTSYGRKTAADLLGEIRDPTAIPALIQTLHDDDVTVRQAAVKALGEIGGPLAVAALIEALKDEGEIVRCGAAGSLGMFRDRSAIPALRTALQDESAEVRSRAAEALKNGFHIHL